MIYYHLVLRNYSCLFKLVFFYYNIECKVEVEYFVFNNTWNNYKVDIVMKNISIILTYYL